MKKERTIKGKFVKATALAGEPEEGGQDQIRSLPAIKGQVEPGLHGTCLHLSMWPPDLMITIVNDVVGELDI